MKSSLRKIASFIPKKDRLKLFNFLFEEYEKNAEKTAKEIGITIRQVYFYLQNGEKKIRNSPNDETTYYILKAYLNKNPEQFAIFLKIITNEFNSLVEKYSYVNKN